MFVCNSCHSGAAAHHEMVGVHRSKPTAESISKICHIYRLHAPKIPAIAVAHITDIEAHNTSTAPMGGWGRDAFTACHPATPITHPARAPDTRRTRHRRQHTPHATSKHTARAPHQWEGGQETPYRHLAHRTGRVSTGQQITGQHPVQQQQSHDLIPQ